MRSPRPSGARARGAGLRLLPGRRVLRTQQAKLEELGGEADARLSPAERGLGRGPTRCRPGRGCTPHIGTLARTCPFPSTCVPSAAPPPPGRHTRRDVPNLLLPELDPPRPWSLTRIPGRFTRPDCPPSRCCAPPPSTPGTVQPHTWKGPHSLAEGSNPWRGVGAFALNLVNVLPLPPPPWTGCQRHSLGGDAEPPC